MTPAQCSEARILARMSQAGLSGAAFVPPGRSMPSDDNLASMRMALENAGVEFINGDRLGVRLRESLAPQNDP